MTADDPARGAADPLDPDPAALAGLADSQAWAPGTLEAAGRVSLAAMTLRAALLAALTDLGAPPTSKEETVGGAIRRLRIYAIAELPAGGQQHDAVAWCDTLAAAHHRMGRALTDLVTPQPRSRASETVLAVDADLRITSGLLLHAAAVLTGMRLRAGVGRPALIRPAPGLDNDPRRVD